MTPRKIVRDPSVLSGRWRLEETLVPIADIRREANLGRAGLKQRYAFVDLTDEEIDAIMAFEFPAIREPSISVNEDMVTVQCECGEESSAPATAPETEITCPCARTWHVRLTMERVSGPKPTQLPADGD